MRSMLFIGLNLLFATWLLLSAFGLPHTPISSGMTWLTALLVAVIAFVSAGKPSARYAIAALAFLLAVGALLLPGISTAAAVNNTVVAALLLALSLVRPRPVAPRRDASQEPVPSGGRA